MRYNTSAAFTDATVADTLPDAELETTQSETFYAWRIRKLRELHKKRQALKAQGIAKAH